MSEVVFAYGSNMCRGRFLKYKVHPQGPGIPGRLPDYSLRFNKKSTDASGKANVESREGEEVWGVLYTIPDADLQVLDKGEAGYKRIPKQVVGSAGPVEAWVYVAKTPSNDRSLRPYSWYKCFLVEGARSHGLPPDYIARLEAIEAVEDQDLERGRRKQRLICDE
jgi:hypothetical protein